MILINHTISIPEEELIFTASRSSGPGGQNVNKLNTRVTLWFDIDNSRALSDEQKKTLHQKLATRINRKGHLWIVCKTHRTQLANREAAVDRFIQLLQDSFRTKKARKPTKPTLAARARRLQEKQRRGQIKQSRSRGSIIDE